MKEHINPNQLNIFENTTHGFVPYKEARFHGHYVKKEKHQKHFKGQAKYMIENFCNGEFWSTVEWVSKTGFAGADRILRHIANGEFPGYGREQIKTGDLHFKYRIVKLDK